MELDADSAQRLLERAIEADPAFLPAHFLRIESSRYSDARGARSVRANYADRGRRSADALTQCLAIVARAPTGHATAPVRELLVLEERVGTTPCTSLFLTTLSADLTPLRAWGARILAISDRAVLETPEVGELWVRRAALLLQLNRAADAAQSCREGLTKVRHAVDRLRIGLALADALDAAGDTSGSSALRRALDIAIERDGRPQFRLLTAPGVQASHDPRMLPARLSLTEWRARERVRIASRAHSAHAEWSARRELAVWLSDAGRPTESLEHFNRIVAIADSLDAPLMQVDSYRFRGRALAKLGQWARAESDLQRAITAGADAGSAGRYLLSESWHNLAHVYEGAGRLADANRAVNRFIELTRPFEFAQPRMMSLHDAGIIRWKTGWAASSNEAFADMVQVVDAQERNYYWAGQYFERIGDYARARRYYRLGYERDAAERSLNLGGLTRVYLALGQPDSAAVTARLHDDLVPNQLDVPLLPAILAQQGKRSEARALATAWVRQHSADGNVHAQAVATNNLADLLLSWGAAPDARREAFAAESLARRINLTEELIRALRTRGTAEMQLGQLQSGLATLQQSAALAGAHATTDNTVATHVALGDGLALLHQDAKALAAYDKAARSVEQVTTMLDHDLDRVRYRVGQLAAFDGAVRVLARDSRAPGAIEGIARWSARRKAASLALATGVRDRDESRSATGTGTVRALQQRLRVGTVVIDYQFPDSLLAALVVSRERAELVRTTVSLDSIRKLASRLTRPFHEVYGGTLDLARAAFDSASARALGQALLAPLEGQLRGAAQLVIVPDGPLYALPFDALIISDSTAGEARRPRFAVERFEIAIAPSLAFVGQSSAASTPVAVGPATRSATRATTRATTPSEYHRERALRVLVIAQDAPGVNEELSAIRRAWPGEHVTVLRNAEATENVVVTRARDFDVLHFATHATADDRDPLASHLRLAASSSQDGFLHQGEIAALHLSPRLVVLSACQTLHGPLYAGEGLMGLARAFLLGGAKSVVATQWPNGAPTALLMDVFHRQLAAGASPSRALRIAKNALRTRRETSHPFFWAGFVVVE